MKNKETLVASGEHGENIGSRRSRSFYCLMTRNEPVPVPNRGISN
jgi:hypothetical protein